MSISDQSNDQIKIWEAVYHSQSKILYGYLLKKTGPESAGDILQESFLKLLQMMQKGQKIDNHRAYVFQIARNLLKLEYKNRSMAFTETEISPAVSDNRSDLLNDTIKKEFLTILDSSKKELSETENEILELRWYAGLTQTEIAKIINKSERQVRRDIEKIISKLKKKFSSSGWSENDFDLNK